MNTLIANYESLVYVVLLRYTFSPEKKNQISVHPNISTANTKSTDTFLTCSFPSSTPRPCVRMATEFEPPDSGWGQTSSWAPLSTPWPVARTNCACWAWPWPWPPGSWQIPDSPGTAPSPCPLAPAVKHVRKHQHQTHIQSMRRIVWDFSCGHLFMVSLLCFPLRTFS